VVGIPDSEPRLACNDPERTECGVGVRRRCRSAATLAALAVAVAGDDERLGHLESDGPAAAATCERQMGHRNIITDAETTAAPRCQNRQRTRSSPRFAT
jgi:hypothetical protein